MDPLFVNDKTHKILMHFCDFCSTRAARSYNIIDRPRGFSKKWARTVPNQKAKICTAKSDFRKKCIF